MPSFGSVSSPWVAGPAALESLPGYVVTSFTLILFWNQNLCARAKSLRSLQAWNMRPKSEERKGTPSAEFVESALIFFYGASNVFLEHLARWGAEWSAQDLEHVSIAILFLGGGLVSTLF